MTLIKKGDYTGYSHLGIVDALQNALEKVGEHSRFEIVQTLRAFNDDSKLLFQITITAFFD